MEDKNSNLWCMLSDSQNDAVQSINKDQCLAECKNAWEMVFGETHQHVL